jgi:hypothetical protein
MGIAAKWEVESDRKVAKNMVMREFSKLKAARTAALDERREQLAQKLYREEEALRSELLNSKETPEERRASLATRAKALWEAREAERQAEASALLDRHFRCKAFWHSRFARHSPVSTVIWPLAHTRTLHRCSSIVQYGLASNEARAAPRNGRDRNREFRQRELPDIQLIGD